MRVKTYMLLLLYVTFCFETDGAIDKSFFTMRMDLFVQYPEWIQKEVCRFLKFFSGKKQPENFKSWIIWYYYGILRVLKSKRYPEQHILSQTIKESILSLIHI